MGQHSGRAEEGKRRLTMLTLSTFCILEEDHTLGNLLRWMLMKKYVAPLLSTASCRREKDENPDSAVSSSLEMGQHSGRAEEGKRRLCILEEDHTLGNLLRWMLMKKYVAPLLSTASCPTDGCGALSLGSDRASGSEPHRRRDAVAYL
jgi:DNA-directed RNA polymerase subunit L